MSDTRKRGGWSNPASAANGRRSTSGGRPPTKAVIHDGDGVMLSHVLPDGTADLGRGRAVVERVGRGRLIKIAQEDGSEIRILVVK